MIQLTVTYVYDV